ncbi:LytTr DNA-binding domain protein [compost metagenome]
MQIADIIRCESNVNYTEFFFTNSKRIVVSRTLKDFEDILGELGFFRVHQSHLVNTKMIQEFVKVEGGHLIMSDGKMIPVSTRKRADVVRMLEQL